MMHLIKTKYKYVVMDCDKDTIAKYCGIDAKILCSWEEEKQEEALRSFFSGYRIEPDIIDLCAVSGVPKTEVHNIIDERYKQNEAILPDLIENEVITSEEKEELGRLSEKSKKKQLDLVSEIYIRNPFSKKNMK